MNLIIVLPQILIKSPSTPSWASASPVAWSYLPSHHPLMSETFWSTLMPIILPVLPWFWACHCPCLVFFSPLVHETLAHPQISLGTHSFFPELEPAVTCTGWAARAVPWRPTDTSPQSKHVLARLLLTCPSRETKVSHNQRRLSSPEPALYSEGFLLNKCCRLSYKEVGDNELPLSASLLVWKLKWMPAETHTAQKTGHNSGVATAWTTMGLHRL